MNEDDYAISELRDPTSSKLGKVRNINTKEGRPQDRALGDSCLYCSFC